MPPGGSNDAAWLGEITALPNPAGTASRYPHLAATPAGPVVLSWLQPQAGGGFALQYARWRHGSWHPAATGAQGADWFVNWADFPSVVAAGPTLWTAPWLQQRPGSVYTYDVRIATSADEGRGLHWQ